MKHVNSFSPAMMYVRTVFRGRLGGLARQEEFRIVDLDTSSLNRDSFSAPQEHRDFLKPIKPITIICILEK